MRVLKNLSQDVERNGGHLSTGNLCTKFLLETLAAGGRGDLAYRVATQRTYPSWGFMLENGATTLWERWEELTGGGMNSHNHPMMGSVSSWFFKYLGGIQVDPSGPGFARFLVRPFVPEDLGWAEASYHSLQGPIRSAWRKEGTRLTMEISVPVNSTATVYVPADANRRVREGDQPADKAEGVKYLRNEAGSRVFEVGSGDYEFTSAPN
jgi:alpha-L-rhamnosidase